MGWPGQVYKAGGGRQGWKEDLPQASWHSVLSTTMCNPLVEGGSYKLPQAGETET